MKSIISIIERITKWIDEWKQNSALRKQKKITAIREELAEIKVRLEKYGTRFKDNVACAEYVALFERKRVLERKLEMLAG